MLLQIPAPLVILGKPFSLLEMARHITSKESRYNKTAEGARSGVRLVTALASATDGKADVLEEDLRLFASVIEAPSCGWGAHAIKVPVPSGDGTMREIERVVYASAADYLPIVDAIAAVAKALPPLKK